jgi:hypothetical protein
VSGGGGRVTPALRAILDRLGEGWVWIGRTSRGHARLRHEPTGALVVVGDSSRDPRAIRNMVTDARRAVARAMQEGRRA